MRDKIKIASEPVGSEAILIQLKNSRTDRYIVTNKKTAPVIKTIIITIWSQSHWLPHSYKNPTPNPFQMPQRNAFTKTTATATVTNR